MYCIDYFALVSDNILPPVESMPIRRLNSSDWDESDLLVIPVLPIQAETVIVQQTDTTQCQDLDSCFVLLKEIKVSSSLIYFWGLSF